MFIGSPGGLEKERKRFAKLCAEFNDEHAREIGFEILATGHEIVGPKNVRGQEAVNEELRRADYFVLMLHERWGSSTGDRRYSSGTEEEYALARRCLGDETLPMRDIAILFKAIDPIRMADAGPQLSKVLAFREKVEAGQNTFFKQFDATREFEHWIRWSLHRWLRDHENASAQPPKRPLPPASGRGRTLSAERSKSAEDVAKAARILSREGRHTAAEYLLAESVVADPFGNRSAEYERVLRRGDRSAAAVDTSQERLEAAVDSGQPGRALDSYVNLALTLRRSGDVKASARTWRQAVRYCRKLGPGYADRLGFLLDNLGLTLRRLGKLKEAQKAVESAIRIRLTLLDGAPDDRGLAHSYSNLGLIQRDDANLRAAAASYMEASRLFRKTKDIGGRTVIEGRLGSVRAAEGNYAEALKHHERELKLARQIPDRRKEAFARANLAAAYLGLEQLEKAQGHARKSLQLNEVLGDGIGLATSLEVSGRIQVARGQYKHALKLYDESFRIFDRAEHHLGAVGLLQRRAAANLGLGKVQDAELLVAEAQARHAATPVPRLRAELDDLVIEIINSRRKR